ncbi:MAG TPA: GGDEF domain-containing protein, partial [Gemmataceae bacterium]|nr:GGDEF domain-containing protein [Gemmataceae bacterium]
MMLRTAQVLDNDRSRREHLFARLADNPNLPSPPGIVLQILEKASRLDCTPAELAAVIHRDAALCGKILRIINSALYALPRSITSIQRAVALLGLNSLRSLVLSLSLPALQRQASRSPSTQTFWKESVAGAMVAHELAIHLRRPSPEDDLVAGLLRDIGVLALQQVCPTDYARLLTHSDQQLARSWCRLERQLLGADHAEVSAFLLGRWWLPEEITEAVRHHHAPERADSLPHAVAERAHLLAFASRIARLQLDAGQSELLHDIYAFGRRHYGLDETALNAFLEPLAKKIEDFATLLDLDIGACDHYPRIMSRAAEALAQLTLETSVDQMRILEQKRQAEQEAQQFRAKANRLRHELLRDPLTGAFNRGCLEEQLRLQFRRAVRRGTVLGLIFIDLDDFKAVNDRFGHLVGDRVLKQTCSHLFAAVREGDIVARYGGDEFCVLIENTSPDGLRAMTDRLGQALNNRALQAESPSASVGAVLCLPRTYPLPATELLDVADRAMYAAKANGKNQTTFVSLLSDADLRFLDAVQRRKFGA